MSSSQWTRTTAQPEPLRNSYWEQQRIAKGIAKPSAYPEPSTQATRQQGQGPALQANWGNSPGKASHGTGSWQGSPSGCWGPNTTKSVFEKLPPGSALNPPPDSTLSPESRPAYRATPPVTRPSNEPVAPSHPNAQPRRRGGRRSRGGRKNRSNRAKQPPGSEGGWSNELQTEISNPSYMDGLELDLSGYRMPRPNKDYAGSEYSLPSVGSDFNISDTGVGDPDSNGTEDIRNVIGLEPNIQVHNTGNAWTTYNWANPTGRDYDETFFSDSYLSEFIKAWVNDCPDHVLVSFDSAVHEHWRCDIDTVTGSFVEPVVHPESMVNLAEIDPELEWKRQNWSSTLLGRRRCPPPNRYIGQPNRCGRPPSPARIEDPPILDERLITKVHERVIERPDYHRYVPRIPCFLRPAEKSDMEEVTRIYNWEVDHGMQALDSWQLQVEGFEQILRDAQFYSMPFIVAVRGSARNLGLTAGNLVYATFDQVPFDESDKRGEILGFAYLSNWQPGLAGTGTGSSRSTARINVFVHPDYRRKKIGFSLLDMLLTTLSDCFSTQSAYDFVDPDDSQLYKMSRHREHQFYHLYISFRVRHKRLTQGDKKLEEEQKTYDDDLVWVKNLLEDQLNFTELVRYEAVHRSPEDSKGQSYWMDEIVFEHTCAFGSPT